MAYSKRSATSNGLPDVAFIDLSLDAKQEKHLASGEFQKTRWYDVLDDIMDAGYKVTLKEDVRTHSCMALVQNAEYRPNEVGTIWVMRSGTAKGALLKVLYYWAVSEGTLPLEITNDANRTSDEALFT